MKFLHDRGTPTTLLLKNSLRIETMPFWPHHHPYSFQIHPPFLTHPPLCPHGFTFFKVSESIWSWKYTLGCMDARSIYLGQHPWRKLLFQKLSIIDSFSLSYKIPPLFPFSMLVLFFFFLVLYILLQPPWVHMYKCLAGSVKKNWFLHAFTASGSNYFCSKMIFKTWEDGIWYQRAI